MATTIVINKLAAAVANKDFNFRSSSLALSNWHCCFLVAMRGHAEGTLGARVGDVDSDVTKPLVARLERII